jgi:multimeric flavodoxin WrbA
MKALIINGSPHQDGCTFAGVSACAEGLQANGVDFEIAWIGQDPVKPCIGCGACHKTSRCAFGSDDGINALIEKAIAADALVLGSPVHYAGITGSLKSTLDRMFFAAGSAFAFKPGGAIVSARRAGTTAALEQLNKYFLISQMLLVGSFYWPMVHGQEPSQVAQDAEGVQTAHQLGANIAWLLKSLEAGKAAGITPTILEGRAWTNFVR